MLREDVVIIRFLLKVIENLVAAFPALTLGPFIELYKWTTPRH